MQILDFDYLCCRVVDLVVVDGEKFSFEQKAMRSVDRIAQFVIVLNLASYFEAMLSVESESVLIIDLHMQIDALDVGSFCRLIQHQFQEIRCNVFSSKWGQNAESHDVEFGSATIGFTFFQG